MGTAAVTGPRPSVTLMSSPITLATTVAYSDMVPMSNFYYTVPRSCQMFIWICHVLDVTLLLEMLSNNSKERSTPHLCTPQSRYHCTDSCSTCSLSDPPDHCMLESEYIYNGLVHKLCVIRIIVMRMRKY